MPVKQQRNESSGTDDSGDYIGCMHTFSELGVDVFISNIKA